MIYYESPYLAHHGIRGMRWGIRRYQNPDGSLTEAGKKKYAKAKQTLEKLEQKRNKNLTPEEVEERKKRILATGSAKDIIAIRGELSTQELKEANDRLATLEQIAAKQPRERTLNDKLKDWSDRAKHIGSMVESGASAIAKVKDVYDKFNPDESEAAKKKIDRYYELENKKIDLEKKQFELDKAKSEFSNLINSVSDADKARLDAYKEAGKNYMDKIKNMTQEEIKSAADNLTNMDKILRASKGDNISKKPK